MEGGGGGFEELQGPPGFQPQLNNRGANLDGSAVGIGERERELV